MRKSVAVEGQVSLAPAWNGSIGKLWVELRPQQWLKNLLVLAPLLFSLNLFAPLSVARALMTFGFFCLISSSVYLLNDIKDRKEDRKHPIKCRRPIAAGEISVRLGLLVMVATLCFALVGGWALNKNLAFVLLGYWLINLVYSIWLKHQVILDVFALASGFVLRVVGGAVAIQVEMSEWLLLCTILLSLFLGFSKRRHELVLLGDGAADHRKVLGDYSLSFLDMMIGIVTASTVMSYALYTVSESTVNRFHTRGLLLTLPFVLYGIFRYLYLVYHKEQGGDPTMDLITDRHVVVDLCLWGIVVGVILYWK